MCHLQCVEKHFRVPVSLSSIKFSLFISVFYVLQNVLNQLTSFIEGIPSINPHYYPLIPTQLVSTQLVHCAKPQHYILFYFPKNPLHNLAYERYLSISAHLYVRANCTRGMKTCHRSTLPLKY